MLWARGNFLQFFFLFSSFLKFLHWLPLLNVHELFFCYNHLQPGTNFKRKARRKKRLFSGWEKVNVFRLIYVNNLFNLLENFVHWLVISSRASFQCDCKNSISLLRQRYLILDFVSWWGGDDIPRRDIFVRKEDGRWNVWCGCWNSSL